MINFVVNYNSPVVSRCEIGVTFLLGAVEITFLVVGIIALSRGVSTTGVITMVSVGGTFFVVDLSKSIRDSCRKITVNDLGFFLAEDPGDHHLYLQCPGRPLDRFRVYRESEIAFVPSTFEREGTFYFSIGEVEMPGKVTFHYRLQGKEGMNECNLGFLINNRKEREEVLQIISQLGKQGGLQPTQEIKLRPI